MAEFTYNREQLTVIVLRVPTAVWNRWEYRHKHYGKAIHVLREHCVDIMASRGLAQEYQDVPDPFFVEGESG